ncbi:hypothetical protein ACROYT_G000118 [Oculina patagonica]
MNNSTAANASLADFPGSSVIVYSKAEGIAWCSAFILTSLFIVVGNLLTIVLFAVNKQLRKRSLFLIINMAFADLMLGALSLPGYIFFIGATNFHLWTGIMPISLDYTHDVVDTFFMHASLISAVMISGERFYVIYSPYKRTLSIRTYRIAILMSWILTAIVVAVETGLGYLTSEAEMCAWISFGLIVTSIICGCNIAIWRKFQQGGVTFQQQNRVSRSKRLTKTLLFVSVLALLSWLPLIIMDALEYIFGVTISADNFYYIITLVNYSNSFINPIVYVFRIAEFRQVLTLCCFKRQAAMSMENTERRRNRSSTLTSATQLRTLRTDPRYQSLLQQEFIYHETTV